MPVNRIKQQQLIDDCQAYMRHIKLEVLVRPMTDVDIEGTTDCVAGVQLEYDTYITVLEDPETATDIFVAEVVVVTPGRGEMPPDVEPYCLTTGCDLNAVIQAIVSHIIAERSDGFCELRYAQERTET